VGRLSGIVNFCGQLGAITAPILTGFVAKITGSFSLAFVAATGILILGIGGYIFLLRRIEPIPEPTELTI
jgi:MFS transporter, ACS family, D-galactonate transporter